MNQYGERIYLNDDWKFSKEFRQEMIEPGYDDSNMEKVRLPHTNKLLSYNYVNVKDYEMISGYRTTFELGQECMGKTLLLTFEGAAHEASVYVNGKKATVHKCGYTSFTVDISALAVYDRPNVLAVRLDSNETLNQPPFGHVIDYMTYGGIYREVYLEVKNPVYIEDVYVYSGVPEDYKKQEADSDNKESADKNKDDSLNDNATKSDNMFTYEITIADKVDIKGQKGYYAEIELYQTDGTFIRKLDDCDISKEIRFGEQSENVNKSMAIQNLRNKLNGKEFAGALDDVKRHIIVCSQKSDDLMNWDIDNPQLYELRVTLKKRESGNAFNKNVLNMTQMEQRDVNESSGQDMALDRYYTRFGLRRTKFAADGFYLNGRKVKLRGVNRHQSFPYAGYAMPESVQKTDADIIKNELGMNAVRTSHYPQSRHFLDRCDELGILVFTEIPGWQFVGDEEWKKILCQDVEEMVLQNRSHPSVILWGVRVNESKDDDALYTMTNQIAHELDNTRATAGVRYLKKSSLLEDVYTYNDFLYDGDSACIEKKKDVTSDESKAYLISEYNGHMYPTKTFDSEEHRLCHALRHAKVLNAYSKDSDVAGGFAWCMADYNTHRDFGSGDSICYHGIMDMFRNPKLAASPYACMSENNVLEVSSSMDIGEHPAGRLGYVYVFTNADSVKLYKNDEFIKEYQCKKTSGRKKCEFDGLEHPPVLIDDMIGSRLEKNEQFSHGKAEDVKKILAAVSKYGANHIPMDVKMRAAKLMTFHHMKFQDAYDLYGKYIGDWGNSARSYRFEAVKNGEVVKTVVKEPVTEVKLTAVSDHTHLIEKTTYDVAAVRIAAKDQNDNVLAFCNEPLMIETSGDIELIGPSIVSLCGGYSGTYVKTTGKSGEGMLTVSNMRGNCISISFTIGIS